MPQEDTHAGLRFGTSGLRDTVANLTDAEVSINTQGFIAYLAEIGEVRPGTPIAVGGDLRASTPRIRRAVIQAIRDSGCEPDDCGLLPSPALAYYAMQRQIPSIMVTGSHIPDDRNGVKFTKRSGEVLKSDEAGILKHVAKVRKDNRLTFHVERSMSDTCSHTVAIEGYVERYLNVFPPNCLTGIRIVLYQHSAVGRDILARVLGGLGAEVLAPTETIRVAYTDEDTGEEVRDGVALRSDTFVPVDTEKVTGQTRAVLTYLAERYTPDFIISADGDTDRPLLADEHGSFLPGDKLGLLALYFLMQGSRSVFAALPISTNDGVVSALRKRQVQLALTKIGSPYIIAAMQQATDADLVVGWEANGGFLLGSPLELYGCVLSPLPTRDAVLPLLATMLLAKQRNKTASELIRDTLEPRYNVAAVTDDSTPGAHGYTSEVGKQIIQRFSPSAHPLQQVGFAEDGVRVLGTNGECMELSSGSTIGQELCSIRDALTGYFAPVGLRTPISINYIDGIRVTFAEGNVVYHMRPSGNAPEFRNYVTANSAEEAERIIQARKSVIPAIIHDILHRP